MEREREEHLQPRLHLQEIKEPNQPPVAVSDSESDDEPLPVVHERLQPDRQQHTESPKIPAHHPASRNGSHHHHHQQQQQQQHFSEPKPTSPMSTSPVSTEGSAPGLYMDESSQSPSSPGVSRSAAARHSQSRAEESLMNVRGRRLGLT